MSKQSDEQKAKKLESEIVNKMANDIKSGKAKEFFNCCQMESGVRISYGSEGARPMIGKFYKEWNS